MSTTMMSNEGKAEPPAFSSIQDIPLEKIRESASNPRRAFDENQLREFADFVPGNKIGLMWPSPLCDVRFEPCAEVRKSVLERESCAQLDFPPRRHGHGDGSKLWRIHKPVWCSQVCLVQCVKSVPAKLKM